MLSSQIQAGLWGCNISMLGAARILWSPILSTICPKHLCNCSHGQCEAKSSNYCWWCKVLSRLRCKRLGGGAALLFQVRPPIHNPFTFWIFKWIRADYSLYIVSADFAFSAMTTYSSKQHAIPHFTIWQQTSCHHNTPEWSWSPDWCQSHSKLFCRRACNSFTGLSLPGVLVWQSRSGLSAVVQTLFGTTLGMFQICSWQFESYIFWWVHVANCVYEKMSAIALPYHEPQLSMMWYVKQFLISKISVVTCLRLIKFMNYLSALQDKRNWLCDSQAGACILFWIRSHQWLQIWKVDQQNSGTDQCNTGDGSFVLIGFGTRAESLHILSWFVYNWCRICA